MSIKISKCPRCGRWEFERLSKGDKRHARRCQCGLQSQWSSDYDTADACWNDLCEDIRVGRIVVKGTRKGWMVVAASKHFKIYNDETGKPYAADMLIQFDPIPAFVPDLLDWRDVMQEARDLLAHTYPDHTEVMVRIDTVIAQAKEGAV